MGARRVEKRKADPGHAAGFEDAVVAGVARCWVQVRADDQGVGFRARRLHTPEASLLSTGQRILGTGVCLPGYAPTPKRCC